MIIPDGYSDVPAGKIACVVTHLEMTARPAPRPNPPGEWSLRKIEMPDLGWYRDLYRRVGEEWLWFSRIRMPDAELAAKIQSPVVASASRRTSAMRSWLTRRDAVAEARADARAARHRQPGERRRPARGAEPRAGHRVHRRRRSRGEDSPKPSGCSRGTPACRNSSPRPTTCGGSASGSRIALESAKGRLADAHNSIPQPVLRVTKSSAKRRDDGAGELPGFGRSRNAYNAPTGLGGDVHHTIRAGGSARDMARSRGGTEPHNPDYERTGAAEDASDAAPARHARREGRHPADRAGRARDPARRRRGPRPRGAAQDAQPRRPRLRRADGRPAGRPAAAPQDGLPRALRRGRAAARHRVPLALRAPPAPVHRPGARRLPAGRQGRRPEQARPARRGLRPPAAGAGAADDADRRRADGRAEPDRGGVRDRGGPHLHDDPRRQEARQHDGHQRPARHLQGKPVQPGRDPVADARVRTAVRSCDRAGRPAVIPRRRADEGSRSNDASLLRDPSGRYRSASG